MSTSLTLHLQTQVVSIVEALAKSAIAEIRKVIDEGTEVSCLEMSRSKKENETLKRRLLQMEKELEAARKGIKIRAVAGDRIRTVKEQIGDEIRGADAPSSDNYVSEEEQPFSIDGAFGKECSVSLWKEEAPMQPVTSEEGTQTGEDRAGLFSSKVEQFEENLEDSEPHGGLKICDGGFESGRDSTERRYGEESDAPPAPAEVTREPCSPPAAAGSRRDERALPDATEGPAEPYAGPAPPPPQNATGPAPPPPQNAAGPAPPPPQNAAGPAPPPPQNAAGPAPPPSQNAAGPAPPPSRNAAGPQPEGPRRYFLRDRNADAAKGQEGAGKGQERAGTKPLACTHCGRSFSYFGSFQKHVRTCPSGSGNRLCQKAEPEQRESVEAGQEAFGNGWLSCEHCTKRFSCLYDLETHLAVHGEKPFRCNDCGKYYLEKWHLNSHLCSLTGEKPYKCIDCGNGFSQEAHLSLHQCSQRREKPYSCTNSGDDSSQKRKFESQHRIYREGNFYSCAACERHFVNMNTFDRYLCIRTVKKPHRCFECGKCFTERSSLNLHQRTIHAGEKPYSCAECGKNFTKKVHFQKHQIIHAGEKPYRCLECGKRFTEKGHLKKHHLIHTRVKPYSCRECGKWFYHKAGLNSHERNHRRKAK